MSSSNTEGRRDVRACTECRKQKIRCIQSDASTICGRCERQSLSCVFLPHHRGKRIEESNTPLQPGSGLSGLGQFMSGASRFPFLSNMSDRWREVIPLVDMTDPASSEPGTSEPVANDTLDDPVSAGYLEEAHARELFSIYMLGHNRASCLLDPISQTHDHVRDSSPLLYTVILAVTTRLQHRIQPQADIPSSVRSAHQQCLVMARDHLTWAFAEAVSSVEIVQALGITAIYKEPDDRKSAHYFARAVVLARELGLDKVVPKSSLAAMSKIRQEEIRRGQRVWLALYAMDKIFNMQFSVPQLIDLDDPLVEFSPLWYRGSPVGLSDLWLVGSVQVRRTFARYRKLLESNEAGTELSISIISRTINEGLDRVVNVWKEEILAGGGQLEMFDKQNIWLAGCKLNLNLFILDRQLRTPASHSRLVELPLMNTYHVCIKSAQDILLGLSQLDQEHLTLSPDTLLHFAIYAAWFLSASWRNSDITKFRAEDTGLAKSLIFGAIDKFESVSSYKSDNLSLHAAFLRALVELPADPVLPSGDAVMPDDGGAVRLLDDLFFAGSADEAWWRDWNVLIGSTQATHFDQGGSLY